MNKVNSGTIKKYLVVILVVVLIVSISLNLYHAFCTKPLLQREIDWMAYELFESWLEEIQNIGNTLATANTTSDIAKVLNNTVTARRYAGILETTIELQRPPDFTEHLYLRMGHVSIALYGFVSNVGTSQNLDGDTLQKMSNLSSSIGNIIATVGTIEHASDPVQQLREKGVLNQVVTYCKEIEAILGW